LLKKLAGTTRLELATSAVTGQRSNQLNYVPSFVGKLQIQASDCWADDTPDNLISLTDDRLAVICGITSCHTCAHYAGCLSAIDPAQQAHSVSLLSFDPTSTSFLVSSTSPRICVHSETMLPATCPHFDSESE
jgi:hypothetical protein